MAYIVMANIVTAYIVRVHDHAGEDVEDEEATGEQE